MSERENERSFANEFAPSLTPDTIGVLKDLAKRFGSTRRADFPLIESNSDAHFYRLDIDPAIIASFNTDQSAKLNRTLTGVRIEYNDRMVDFDGGEVEAAVSAEVKSIVRAPGEPETVNEVRYLFILDHPQTVIVQDIVENPEPPTVQEDMPISQLTEAELAARLSSRYRPLTEDDAQLLRLLISHL